MTPYNIRFVFSVLSPLGKRAREHQPLGNASIVWGSRGIMAVGIDTEGVCSELNALQKLPVWVRWFGERYTVLSLFSPCASCAGHLRDYRIKEVIYTEARDLDGLRAVRASNITATRVVL